MFLFSNPVHSGALDDATHYGVAGSPGEGPSMELWLRVEGEAVAAARWKTYGCPGAISCAEAVCRVAEGWTLAALRELEPEEIDRLAGGLPEGKAHCPQLAAGALRSARPVEEPK
jgi:nitrogen fixation NifU-like protein